MICHSASTIDWYMEGSVMRTSAFSFSDLSSSSTLRSKILGFSNTFFICSKPAYEKVFLKATPGTRKLWVTLPPGTFLTPTRFRSSTSGSSIEMASTTMGANRDFWLEMSLELRAVPANTSSIARDPSRSTFTAMSLRCWTPATAAVRRPCMMICGWTPSSTKGFTCLRICPAKSTTDVVPSPTSASWDMEMSTSVLAAGWTMSNRRMMVAPSFEMVTRFPSNTSLSIPRGPSVVRIVSATAWHALIFEMSCGFPCEESVPSRRRIMPGC
mmetsp:Transcript_40927/g.92113  ORF Transcript_40927/g.92113 Transcript_40927/m.92113 type:complete len:270 (+) Transcript_40927:955-1764(+)